MLGLRHLRALRGLRRHLDLVARGRQPVYLDYPVHPTPRWGWAQPAHEDLHRVVASGRPRCAGLISDLDSFTDGLGAIPVDPPSDLRIPHWNNHYIEGLDAATLYAFPKLFGSRRYVEIGSGNSTKFVRRSVEDHRLDLRVVSVDPHPRAEIDELCDDIVRESLERAPLDIFDTLGSGDILMCDGSHRCLQNSDVTVLFLEILPRLRPGVLICIDDVYLPYDYPTEWEERYYSEQYLLAVLLLADEGRRYEILFPGFFTSLDTELRTLTKRFWDRVAVPGLEPLQANGFWLRVRE